MTSKAPSPTFIRDLYARLLLTRTVDEYARSLHEVACSDFVASCRGFEAAQIGSAACIQVGEDFTLPYFRDLGVVLTIGMTPYEVFCTYLQTLAAQKQADYQQENSTRQERQHWSYHKHNIVAGPAPLATQLLHAAGIAFACKLRKAPVVTVAYCDDKAVTEADFLESIRFAALHQLPIVFVYEQNMAAGLPSPLWQQDITLPEGLRSQHIDGCDIVAVYTAMHDAMQSARIGQGPTLLELCIPHASQHMDQQPLPAENSSHPQQLDRSPTDNLDPLMRCQQYLQMQDAWDSAWALQLATRITSEVARAMQDAQRDMLRDMSRLE